MSQPVPPRRAAGLPGQNYSIVVVEKRHGVISFSHYCLDATVHLLRFVIDITIRYVHDDVMCMIDYLAVPL